MFVEIPVSDTNKAKDIMDMWLRDIKSLGEYSVFDLYNSQRLHNKHVNKRHCLDMYKRHFGVGANDARIGLYEYDTCYVYVNHDKSWCVYYPMKRKFIVCGEYKSILSMMPSSPYHDWIENYQSSL